MIKNIIFDMGGVLIDYNPEKVAYALFDRETAELLLKILFRSPLWADLDRGTSTPDEVLAKLGDQIPATVFAKVSEMTHNYYPYMPPFENIYDLIAQLRGNGYGIYLLSNASDEFYRQKQNIPSLSLFDGYLISADVGLLKPEPEIYEALFQKFSLKPSECFFIDDVQANIDGAVRAGMAGHCHRSADLEALKSALKEAGVRI